MVELDTIAEDVPIFQELLKSIKEQADAITPSINDLLKRVVNGDITISHGVSLLDVKYNALLSYVQDIITIILSKVNGISIANSEAVDRIVEFRTVLEKLRPLEQKLKYQIDKVIQVSTNANLLSENNPLRFKPNLGNFDESEDENEEDEESTGTKKYVPPHIAAVKLDEGSKKESKTSKLREQALTKSSIISELIEEASDRPMEHSQHSYLKTKAMKQKDARQQFEEEYFTRVNVSKKERALERNALRKSELDTLTNFGKLDILNDGTIENTSKKRKSKVFKSHSKSKKRKFNKR